MDLEMRREKQESGILPTFWLFKQGEGFCQLPTWRGCGRKVGRPGVWFCSCPRPFLGFQLEKLSVQLDIGALG